MTGISQGIRVPRRAPFPLRALVGIEFSKKRSSQRSVQSDFSDSACSEFVTTHERSSRVADMSAPNAEISAKAQIRLLMEQCYGTVFPTGGAHGHSRATSSNPMPTFSHAADRSELKAD